MAHVRPLQRTGGTKAYEVRWRDGTKFRQRTFKVKREADRFALKMEQKVAEGISTTTDVRRGVTVAEVVAASLAASKPNLKPRTYGSYVAVYDRHILPILGGRRAASVTPQDVQDWVLGLHGRGLSPATCRNVFVALNKAMKYAVRHGHIVSNPCTGTELPRKVMGEGFSPRFLTPAEVERLAGELDYFHPYGLIVRFAAYTGLRAGEVAGLRIQDVNLLLREVAVEVTRQRINGEWVTGTPKSARSRRKVPLLVDALVDDLRAHLEEHPYRVDPDARLWPGRTPGSHALDWDRQWDQSAYYRWYFKPGLSRVGLSGVRFHDLRHTYASVMFAAGVEPYKVSRWMGHANLSTTDSIYAHLYDEDYRHEAERLSALLARRA